MGTVTHKNGWVYITDDDGDKFAIDTAHISHVMGFKHEDMTWAVLDLPDGTKNRLIVGRFADYDAIVEAFAVAQGGG